MKTVNRVVNKLYEGLNPNNNISEQAGFLNTEKIKLMEERFSRAI